LKAFPGKHFSDFDEKSLKARRYKRFSDFDGYFPTGLISIELPKAKTGDRTQAYKLRATADPLTDPDHVTASAVVVASGHHDTAVSASAS
jgi:hypothetical protein